MEEGIKWMKKKIENIKEGITYRTSTVWMSPIVEGILPVKSFLSNNLSRRKQQFKTPQKLRVEAICL
jgi:hypothetical protein